MAGTTAKSNNEASDGTTSLTSNFPLFNHPVFPLFGSILSGLLLALSFPGYANSTLAFVALVPLLFSVQSASVKKAAWLGLLSGFVFFLMSLSWLHNLTGTVEGGLMKASAVLGGCVLALYCALYFIPFAVVASIVIRAWCGTALRKNIRLMFSLTVVWVASEYLRSFLFTGFPWNLIGISQYANPAIIQVAEWGGVYLVSAYLIWMNIALFITFRQYSHGNRAKRYRPHYELMLGLLPVALSVMYGMNILFNQPRMSETARVALIQPNIPQAEKWDEAKDQEIRTQLEELTETATRLDGLDLIIWPETALPDFVRIHFKSYSLVKRVTAAGVPLLTGSMDVAFADEGNVYFNSSVLFDTNGVMVAKYDKQHLVPFGEYVPLPGLMRKFTPVEIDFQAGTESSLLPLDEHGPFSVLICFEDTVAPLAVNAVRNGARWLVSQSNDAWFDPSAQSEQHLAHAVFRCVENRVPMARNCNTGVSCTINAYGVIQRSLKVCTAGFTIGEIHPRPMGQEHTFYTRFGDVFAKFCLVAAATVIFVLRSKLRAEKAGRQDDNTAEAE